jgi:hypothetical protein
MSVMQLLLLYYILFIIANAAVNVLVIINANAAAMAMIVGNQYDH